MPRVRHRLAAILALATACLIAGPAGALGAGKVSVTGAKKESGPYQATPDPSDFIPVTVQEPRDLFSKVRNKTNKRQHVRLMGNAGGDVKEFKFTWFQGERNITAAIQDKGYEFILKPSKSRVFRVRVKPLTKTADVCLYPTANAGGADKSVFFGINGNLCN